MKLKTLLAISIATGVFASSAAIADHKSPMGAGTANMPNDIHNTRIEDDNETFLNLVQQGGGAIAMIQQLLVVQADAQQLPWVAVPVRYP